MSIYKDDLASIFSILEDKENKNHLTGYFIVSCIKDVKN